jgi:hypothetical protein
LKIALIGGTFDLHGGRQSGFINKLAAAIMNHAIVKEFRLLNGGTYSELMNCKDSLHDEDAILWFADVPNEAPKNRNIKKLYPNKLLVVSKRNNDEYSFQEIISRALMLKANLTVEFKRSESGVILSRVSDPLGSIWCDFTDNISELASRLLNRLFFLKSMTRVGTVPSDERIAPPDEREFVALVRTLAGTFHELIHPAAGVTRFLGNASFRCRHGFPSFRAEDNTIFVSRRNMDKREMSLDNFVPVKRRADGSIVYYHDDKPSVDTPIQLALYEYYHNVRYMVHSHVYLEEQPFTQKPIPCGALEEVSEIQRLFPDQSESSFAVNLIGHGSLILANNVADIAALSSKYYSRPMPEVMNGPDWGRGR